MPVHEHDCDHCTFIGSYPMKHPFQDDEHGYRTGTPFKWVGMADVYLACDNSGYKYIVRYGKWGEYATTNTVTHYVKAPLIDGEDPYANASIPDSGLSWSDIDIDNLPELPVDLFPDLG